jgi:phage terminase large subunit
VVPRHAPASRVITTATKWSQVKNLLWHEVNQLAARARKRPEARAGRVPQEPLQTELHLPDGRYAIGLSSKPENSESFAGHHAPNILVVVDEASGVHPAIFEVAEGYMTTDGARMLLIGNPTRSSGEFFDAFNTKRGDYNTLHISALESPAITGEQVPRRRAVALTGKAWVEEPLTKAWGEDSPLYQVRVLGDFAKTPTDTVIDLGHVEDAQTRARTPTARRTSVVISCDVARFGDDETVIAERVGSAPDPRDVRRPQAAGHRDRRAAGRPRRRPPAGSSSTPRSTRGRTSGS